MASTKPFLEAVESRRTIYQLENKSTISDEKIKEIVTFAVKNCPSSYNVQSGRAVILLREHHEKLWDMADAMLKRSVPEQAYQALHARSLMFRGAYGSVLWFEDDTALMGLKQKHPMIAGMVDEWSTHSTGMLQFTCWTAFEAEGLGCNLQHYNFSPEFSKEVIDEWKLPGTWKLHAQLVFGTPKAGPTEKTFESLDERVKMFE